MKIRITAYTQRCKTHVALRTSPHQWRVFRMLPNYDELGRRRGFIAGSPTTLRRPIEAIRSWLLAEGCDRLVEE